MVSHKKMPTLALTVVLLTLPSLTHGETLYVRPTSTNTSCPTHPCHTLSEYAQDLEQYLNDSSDFGKHFNKVYLTLQLLPGSHPVDINLIITSIHRLEILGNSSAVAQVSVVCNANTGLTFSNISEVRIDGLAFVSCGRSHVVQARSIHHASYYGYNYFITYYGLHLQSVQIAEIIDCTFQDSYGSALGVVDSHVALQGNNSFLNNCRLCSKGRCGLCYYWMKIRKKCSLNYDHNCYGGGIFTHGSNLSFAGSTRFLGN